MASERTDGIDMERIRELANVGLIPVVYECGVCGYGTTEQRSLTEHFFARHMEEQRRFLKERGLL